MWQKCEMPPLLLNPPTPPPRSPVMTSTTSTSSLCCLLKATRLSGFGLHDRVCARTPWLRSTAGAMCPVTSCCEEKECDALLPRDCFPGSTENSCQSVQVFTLKNVCIVKIENCAAQSGSAPLPLPTFLRRGCSGRRLAVTTSSLRGSSGRMCFCTAELRERGRH